MVASNAANKMFLPLNSNRANANADKTVITSDNTVDTIPTYSVLRNNVPRLAVLNALT